MTKRMLTSVFALMVVASPAAAQSEWLASEGTSVALEFRRPVLSDEVLGEDIETSLLNGAFFLSGRAQIPVIGLAGVAEIPFAYAKFGLEDVDDSEESSTSIGNIYLGVEKSIMLGAATIVGGVRLPTAAELDDEKPSTFLGQLAGFTDRIDAFAPKTTVPQLGVRVGVPGIPVFDVEANLNANYAMYGGDDEGAEEEDDDNEFYIDGGVRALASVMGLRAGVGIEGVHNLSQDDEEEGDSSFYHVGLHADYAFGMIRPGATFFIPLSSDYSDAIDWMLGLSLEIDLPM